MPPITSRKTKGTATFTVAASDSEAGCKVRADFVCDGTADNVQIQEAIDALPNNQGGEVVLFSGTYYMDNSAIAIEMVTADFAVVLKGQTSGWAKGDGIDCGVRLQSGAAGQTVIRHGGQFGKVINISIDTAGIESSTGNPSILIHSANADQEIANCSLTSAGNRHIEEGQIGLVLGGKNVNIHNNWIEYLNVGIRIEQSTTFMWINDNIFAGNYLHDVLVKTFATGDIWLQRNKSEILVNGYFFYAKTAIAGLRSRDNIIKLQSTAAGVYRFDTDITGMLINGDSYDNQDFTSTYIHSAGGVITKAYSNFNILYNTANLTEIDDGAATGAWVVSP